MHQRGDDDEEVVVITASSALFGRIQVHCIIVLTCLLRPDFSVISAQARLG